MCKMSIDKLLITDDPRDSLETNRNAICDPNYGIYFSDVTCKNFIQQHIGFTCPVCKKAKNEVRKFPS